MSEKQDSAKPAQCGDRFMEFLHPGHDNAEERAYLLKSFSDLSQRLQPLSTSALEFLVVLLKRSELGKMRGHYRSALLEEVKGACAMSNDTLQDLVKILDHHDLGGVYEDDGKTYLYLTDLKTDWNVWGNLRDYCAETSIPLEEIVVKRNFSVLD